MYKTRYGYFVQNKVIENVAFSACIFCLYQTNQKEIADNFETVYTH